MMTLCAEGLVTQRSVFFLLSNIWSGIITAFPVILGIPFSFRNAKGANAILLHRDGSVIKLFNLHHKVLFRHRLYLSANEY